MPKIAYVTCPSCGKDFYVGREFFEIEEAYCHCPYCSQEFKPGAPSPGEMSAQVRPPALPGRGG